MEKLKWMRVMCFKHDGSLHRIWDKAALIYEDEEKIMISNAKTLIRESDDRVWMAKEPSLSIFYKNRWFNIMGIIRSEGVHYYCNMATPSVVDEGVIVSHLHKSIDVINNEEYSDFNNNVFDVKFNKIDDSVKIIKTSTKENLGIEELEETIKEMFFKGDIKINDEVMLTNLRQRDAVKDALDSLLMVKRSLEDNMPEDFLSIDLMGAYSSLGYVIGEEIGEDVVNEIFSKFCMGK